MSKGFLCKTCGQHHAGLPMEFGADAPALYHNIPESERESRCDLTADVCVIDEEHFFIRGCLELPVVDGEGPFVWGVWASLSQDSFRRTCEIWDQEGRESEPPFFGWLSTALPLYPRHCTSRRTCTLGPLGSAHLLNWSRQTIHWPSSNAKALQ